MSAQRTAPEGARLVLATHNPHKVVELREILADVVADRGLAIDLDRTVVLRHALRNALIPIITVLGIVVGELIAGSVITETVFNLPGVGRLVVEAVKRRDYPVIQGGILLVTMGYLTVNLLVDLLYAWANPRIRYG